MRLFWLLFIVIVFQNSTGIAASNKSSSDIISTIKKGKGTFQQSAIRYLYQNKIELSEDIVTRIIKEIKNIKTEEYPEICFLVGQFYQDKGNYNKAYYYYYKTLKSSPNLNDPTKKYLVPFHFQLGLNYFQFKRYDDAVYYLKKYLKFKNTPNSTKIRVYNYLGLICRKRNHFESSREYHRKGFQLAKKENDKPWMANHAGNMGWLSLKEKKYEEARKLLKFDFDISKKNRQYESMIVTLGCLIEIDIAMGETESLPQLMNELKTLFANEKIVYGRKSYYQTLALYQEFTGNYKAAFTNFKLSKFYEDSTMKANDKVAMRNFEYLVNIENQQYELEILNEKRKRDKLRLKALFIILSLTGISSIVIIRQILKRKRLEKNTLVQEKLIIEKNLNVSTNELNKVLESLMEKNSLIEQLKVKILEVKCVKENNNLEKSLLDSLKSLTILTDQDAINFKNLFEKLYPNFIPYFYLNYPDITSTEIRLASLIRLNLTNAEISSALGISIDSVRKTNLRLRKKLGIKKNEQLIQYLFKV